jgi:hypothetical protein
VKEFNASSSNFHKFKQWYSYHNAKLSEEWGCADEIAVSNKNLKLLRRIIIKTNLPLWCDGHVLEMNAEPNLHIKRSSAPQFKATKIESLYCWIEIQMVITNLNPL